MKNTNAAGAEMLTVKNLDYYYHPGEPVLRGVGFSGCGGVCTAVLGNNGAGKSTLLKCLNRVYKPKGGAVYVGPLDIHAMPRKLAARHIAYVAQSNEPSRFTVYDAVLLGRKPFIGMDVRREDHEITEQVLARLGLGGMALRYIDELSGGEFQKVMLARALSQKSKVLLLDEPTSNLDLKNQYEILTLVREIAVAEMISVIMVIHDLNLALRFCDAFLLIRDGRVFAHGGLEVITHENIEAIYGIPVYIETVRGVTVVIPASPSGQPPLISEPLTLPALDNILTMTV